MSDELNNQKPTIAGIGEVLWDLFPSGPRLGGAPANFAAHTANLGANAFIVSTVGDDVLGVEAIAKLQKQGISTEFISQNSKPTGTVEVILDSGQPTYSISENIAWDKCNWGQELASFAPTVDAVCFGTLFQRSATSRNTLCSFLNATNEDCLRVFDVNLRQHFYSEGIIVDSLQIANVLKLNDEELPIVAAAAQVVPDPLSAMRALQEKFSLKMVALTCGAKGSHLLTEKEHHFQTASLIEVVDTVGAGDAFTAAMVMGLVAGNTIDEINRHANEVASNACRTAGGMPLR